MRSAALLVFIVTLPAPALGEQIQGRLAVIAVAGSQASRAQAAALASRLEERLAKQLEWTPLGSKSTRAILSDRSSLDRAERLANRAREELDAFADLDRAAELLDRAAEAHLSQLPALESVDEPVRLLVDLAMVALAQGDEERLREALGRAVQVDPTLDLDPTEAPSRLVRATREARRSHGNDPLLPRGRSQQWAEALGVEWLLVVQPRPGPERILVELYSRATGERARRWLVGTVDLDSVATALTDESGAPGRASQRGGESTEGETRDGEGTPGVQGATPWYRQWWVWTIVGAVVVAGAVAGTVVAVDRSSSTDVGLELRRQW
jgi:hypothetical protein